MFFYTIMNIFITLFENIHKSRTSAGSLSLIVDMKHSSYFISPHWWHSLWLLPFQIRHGV
jgi:hypothetical protein